MNAARLLASGFLAMALCAPAHADDKALIARAQTNVQRKLKAPAAPAFRNTIIHHNENGFSAVCGEVKATPKGFVRFISRGDVDSTYIKTLDKDFPELWKMNCEM